MICYKDRSYCGSKKHKPDCDRQFIPDAAYFQWSQEMGIPEGGPVAFVDFCGEEVERK